MTNAFNSHMRMNLVLVGALVAAVTAFGGATLAHADNQGDNGSHQWTGGQNTNIHHHPNPWANGGNGDNGNGDSSSTPAVTGGTLTIEKDTIDGNGTFSFNVTDGADVNQNLSLTTSNYLAISGSMPLADGSYAVTETPTDGWYLKDTTCENADGVIGTDITNAGVQISMTDGEDVTCAFTNVFETAPVATTTATSTDGGTGTTTPPTDGDGGTGTTTPPTDGGGNSTTTPVVTATIFSGGGFGGGVSGQSGGGSTGGSGVLVPQVLGASTGPTTSCVAPLHSFMRQGQANDSGQVDALQAFLNQELGLNIPLSGTFDASTTANVNAFQLKYSNDVLAPWVKYGLPNAQTPTGYVYKLTEAKINQIACPGNNIPTPIIP